MSVFVTGATGLVGSNLVKKLVENGEPVNILVRKGSNHPFLNNLPIKKFVGDLNDIELLKTAVSGCDVVYHCAAKISFNQSDYKSTYEVNVLGTRNVLQAAFDCGVRKVVHVSSAAAIGVPSQNENLLNEEVPFPEDQKRNGYPYSKWLAEQEVFNFCKKGLNISIANLSSVYGSGEKSFNSGSIIKMIYELPFIIAPPGGCSAIAVDDVVSGLLAIAEKGKTGERYILTGENMTYLKLFDIVSQIVKNKRIKIALPRLSIYSAMFLAKFLENVSSSLGIPSKLLTSDVVKNLFFYRYLDNSKAKKELNWKPKTDINTSLKQAFEFYKEQKML